MKIHMEGAIQKVLDIFEADDGKSFEEKKKDAIAYIETQEDALLAERVLKAAINDKTGKHIKERFWSTGNISKNDERVCLRMVQESDKNYFLELQKETCIVKSMFKEESYQNMMWNEHIQE